MKNKTQKTQLSALVAILMGAVLLAGNPQTAKADTVYFTETFSTGAANWATNSGGLPATWVSTGGPSGLGDGYITRTTPTSGSSVMFRGQDVFDSSGDGFVGNWIGLGVTAFTIDILQDSGADLNFTLRFASAANFPGANTVAFSVPSGVWTPISIPIMDSTNVFQNYEGEDFNTIFSGIGNVQLSIAALPSPSINLSMDNPTLLVPEPSTFALVGMGVAICGMMRRMKR